MESPTTELDRALDKLTALVREGVEHGFFGLHVRGEKVKADKCRLVIENGRSFQFVIPADDLRR